MCNDDVNRPVCLVLSFGKGNGVWKLKGRRSETSSLKEMVPAIAKFMEKCLDDWLLYIKTKRSQFYYLNYFTVDQLVLLQRELVIIGNDSKSELLYPILATVKQDCNQADLNAAIESAKEEQLSAEKNEKIARMALENVDENNTETSFLDQALFWCMMNAESVVNIAKDNSEKPETMKRELPSYFLEGQPNLLICPKDDILKATLTIYEHDKSKPLPSSDEILICHTKTSQDEVDIFWRRAIFGSGGKIYCLVHADLLNYDAGVATQKTLEQNILEANGMGEKQIDIDEFMNGLLDHTSTNGTDIATLFHIDISCEVIEGIDYLLFNLLILGCLTDSKGLVWRRRIDDLYMIETIPSMSYGQNKEPDYVHTMLAVLPDVFCKSPIESISLLNGNSAGFAKFVLRFLIKMSR
ncbi:hypothetical protein DPMN_162640, partial [Dreissena polymorpha]